MTFIEGDKPSVYEMTSGDDITRSLRRTEDVELQNFFSRPQKIYSFQWGTGTVPYVTFNPWELYFNNPRTINRLANFQLLQAKIHLKFVINGNGFLYGRMMATYFPFFDLDDLSTVTNVIQDAVQCSQMPHVYLDPTMSKGGEIVCPFTHYFDYASIPFANWGDLGKVVVRTLNSLKHANGASDSVTVSVFAWAEDVQLAGLTSVDPTTITPQSGYEPQMGEIEEANKMGVVSGPASTVAKVSAALSGVPVIGPYAKATEKVAKGVASAAKMLGYSRPPVTKAPEDVIPRSISSLAVTTVPDNVQKMTVDDKQELTIDPRVFGIGGEDSMDIASIAQRESYITKFSWAVGTSPETLLWNARVSPIIWSTFGSGTTKSFHLPACCSAALPFKYWTGSMKYRFQIVCSNYHKGRLRIVHDPMFSVGGDQYNVQYSHIVDLAETQDFTVEIAPSQVTTLMSHHDPTVDDVEDVYQTTAFTATAADRNIPKHNGTLSVYVMNHLTVPNSAVNNDIEINVYVSAGQDFEVFVPQITYSRFVIKPPLEAQSGYEEDGQNTQDPSAPEQTHILELGPRRCDLSRINNVYTGEAIKSYRQMLKRYNLWTAIGTNLASGGTNLRWRMPWFPYFRGFVNDSVNWTAQNNHYNYCNTVMMHWVTWMFAAMRGSIRYKIVPSVFNAIEQAQISGYIHRYAYDVGYEYEEMREGYTPPNSQSVTAYRSLTAAYDFGGPQGTEGAIYFNSAVNPSVEFEVPFYTAYRFVPGKHRSWTAADTYCLGGWKISAFIPRTAELDIWVGAGEDFNVGIFTGMPRLYLERYPPAPSQAL